MKNLRWYILLLFFFPFLAVSMDREDTKKKKRQLVSHNSSPQIKTCDNTWTLRELSTEAKQKKSVITKEKRQGFLIDNNFFPYKCQDLSELAEDLSEKLSIQLFSAITTVDSSLFSNQTKEIKLKRLNVFMEKIKAMRKTIRKAPKILQDKKELFSRKFVTDLIRKNKILVKEKKVLINTLNQAQQNIQELEERDNKDEVEQKIEEIKDKLQRCMMLYSEKYKKLKKENNKKIGQYKEGHDKELKNTKRWYFFGGVVSILFVAIFVGAFKALFDICELDLFVL